LGVTAILSTTAQAASPQSAVSTPLAGAPRLDLGRIDLAAQGYVVEEFTVSGVAKSFKKVGEFGEDGRWKIAHAGTAPYVTRIVVVRPRDARKFNGAAAVEWLNVSGGIDLPPDWMATHRELMRSGFAWVGVSAQKVGIEGGPSMSPAAVPLKKADPARYGHLTHPGDAYAYDIYSQVGRLLRNPAAKLMGPLALRRVLAIGESQSAAFLTTYVNAVDPLAQAYDGFVIHSRFGSGASISGASMMGGAKTEMPSFARLRPDLRVPVITVITETDLLMQMGGFLGARQPDTNRLRIWEVPGTAHADTHTFNAAAIDADSTPIATLAASYAATDMAAGMKLAKPINAAPQHHYLVSTAINKLDVWVKTGKAPAQADPMQCNASATAIPDCAADAHGNLLGGVRTPWVDVPTARLSGLGNSGGPLGFLVGVTEPFDRAKLKKLYPGGRAEYLAKFTASLTSSIRAGFILPTAKQEILSIAAESYDQGLK
jgi:hypothetical protein